MHWLAGAALLVFASFLLTRPTAAPTSMLVLVFTFAAWIVITNRWANPSYTPAATYHAIFFLFGFFIGRRAGTEQKALYALVAFALGLSGWALWQRIVGGSARASALFETPATLAATINLVLAPMLVLAIFGRTGRGTLAAVAVLSAGLAASTSRGAWIALLGASIVGAAFVWRAGLTLAPKRLLTTTVMLTTGIGFGVLAPMAFVAPTLSPSVPAFSVMGPGALGSVDARMGLFELAIRALATANPWLGNGYLSFHYVLESGKFGIADYAASTTYFVHNDYLQILLELGIPALVLLVSVIVLPFVVAWRALPQLRVANQQAQIVALCAGISSMAIHAAGDYPFYVPICLLICGAGLGALDRSLSEAGVMCGLPLLGPRWRVLKATGIALGIWVAMTPAAAQGAAALANRAWQAGEAQRAAYWFEVARRIEPLDWRYHWYAGQFWLLQALQGSKPEAAALAEKAFVDGAAANARDVRNVTGLVETHLRLRDHLAEPLDAERLLAMIGHALQLAPNDEVAARLQAQVQAQLARGASKP